MNELEEFFNQCAAAGCVVVPAKVYTEENAYIGVRYVAIRGPEYIIAGDPWVYVDDASSELHDTPEEALRCWRDRRTGRLLCSVHFDSPAHVIEVGTVVEFADVESAQGPERCRCVVLRGPYAGESFVVQKDNIEVLEETK